MARRATININKDYTAQLERCLQFAQRLSDKNYSLKSRHPRSQAGRLHLRSRIESRPKQIMA